MKIFKKTVKLFILFCVLLCAIPITAYAVNVNGNDYTHGVNHYFITSGFGKFQGTGTYVPSDGGHTPNLLGSENIQIPFYGDVFNTDLGRDASLQYGVGTTLNGQSSGRVLITQQQRQNRKCVIGYQGELRSNYRGMNRYIESLTTTDYLYPPVADFAFDGTLLVLPKNQIYVSINGLSQADKNASSIVVQGSDLPNSKSYGSGETFYETANGSYNNADLRYGNYSVQVNIANAQKYDISYEIRYNPGSKYANQGNDIAVDKQSSSNGTINTGTRYMESDGALRVIINCTEKATNSVTVNLTKEAGVSAAVGGRSFQLVKYQNATYAMLDSNGTVVKTGNTNSSGKLVFSGLDNGFYRVKFPNPPTGFTVLPANKSDFFELTGNTNKTVNFSLNVRYDLTVRLIRTDTRFGEGAASGGKFELWQGVKGASGSKLLETKTTGILGTVTFENYLPGTYTVYYKNPSSEDIVSPGQTMYVYLNSNQTVEFKLRAKELKVGWLDVLFYNEDGYYVGVSDLNDLNFVIKGNGMNTKVAGLSEGGITNVYGQEFEIERCLGLVLEEFKPGTYTIEQTKAQPGYQKVNGPISFEIKAGEHTIVEFYNPIIYDFSITLSVPTEIISKQRKYFNPRPSCEGRP